MQPLINSNMQVGVLRYNLSRIADNRGSIHSAKQTDVALGGAVNTEVSNDIDVPLKKGTEMVTGFPDGLPAAIICDGGGARDDILAPLAACKTKVGSELIAIIVAPR